VLAPPFTSAAAEKFGKKCSAHAIGKGLAGASPCGVGDVSGRNWRSAFGPPCRHNQDCAGMVPMPL